MVEPERVEVRHEVDIVTARKAGRDMATLLGFRAVECTQIATAISELARNIFLYAGEGTIVVRVVEGEGGAKGIEIVASDSGPGIEDLEVVMRDGYSTSNGLGLGLPGTRRLMDEFVLESTQGIGTVVRVVKWKVR